MTVDFQPGSCDPHGLVSHDGRLISCDAGIHPGWPGLESPHSGYIFSIEIRLELQSKIATDCEGTASV